VPAYNEGKNIARVLDVLKTYPYFDEIIIVNDGSKDNTAKVAGRYANSKIRLINHKHNKGKTAAILTGIKASKGNMTVMIDADLINLQHKNINKMIYLVLSKKYDLAILDREGDRQAVWGWTNCARLFGGERCFWKKDFNKVKLPENAGYLIETIMNLHYISHHKKIRTIYCKNLFNLHKHHKEGFVQGCKDYYDVGKKIVRHAGVRGFIKMINNIEDDRKPKKSKVKKAGRIKNIQKATTEYITNFKKKEYLKNITEKIRSNSASYWNSIKRKVKKSGSK